MFTIAAQKVVYLEYPQLRKAFSSFAESLAACKYRPAKMDFMQRIRTLARIETAYRGLFSFADRLLFESAKVSAEQGYNEEEHYLRKKLPQYNIIEVSAGPFGDYIVKAPPLGDRSGGNAAFIAYYTELAIKEAKARGEKFEPLTDGCVIVKQYCHCEDVAMGTLENREVHALTDTIIKAAGMDDAPIFFDCCYVWCESDNPRTEIVITPRANVSYYEDFVNNLYEPKTEDVNKQYYINKSRRDKLARAAAQTNALLDVYDTVEVEDGIVTHQMCLFLLHLAKSLSKLIEALRTPYVNEAAHSSSRAYSKPLGKRRRMKKTPEEEVEEEAAFLQRLTDMVEIRDDTLTVKTFSPMNFRREAGRELCDEQEIMLWKGMDSREGRTLFSQCNDLVAEITRFIGDGSYLDVDADNINTAFLHTVSHRVKIIYSRSKSKAPAENYDCVISLYPKSYKIMLS